MRRRRRKGAREAQGGKEAHPVDGRVSWELKRQPAYVPQSHRMQRKTNLNRLEKHKSFVYGTMTLDESGQAPRTVRLPERAEVSHPPVPPHRRGPRVCRQHPRGTAPEGRRCRRPRRGRTLRSLPPLGPHQPGGASAVKVRTVSTATFGPISLSELSRLSPTGRELESPAIPGNTRQRWPTVLQTVPPRSSSSQTAAQTAR